MGNTAMQAYFAQRDQNNDSMARLMGLLKMDEEKRQFDTLESEKVKVAQAAKYLIEADATTPDKAFQAIKANPGVIPYLEKAMPLVKDFWNKKELTKRTDPVTGRELSTAYDPYEKTTSDVINENTKEPSYYSVPGTVMQKSLNETTRAPIDVPTDAFTRKPTGGPIYQTELSPDEAARIDLQNKAKGLETTESIKNKYAIQQKQEEQRLGLGGNQPSIQQIQKDIANLAAKKVQIESNWKLDEIPKKAALLEIDNAIIALKNMLPNQEVTIEQGGQEIVPQAQTKPPLDSFWK